MTATCLMTNCRNSAPSGEAMCAKHRDKPLRGGYVGEVKYREPEGVESFTPLADPAYDINVTRNGDLIGVAEGFRGEPFVTRIYDTREKAVWDALISQGWTPPDQKRETYLAGYNAGFYSAGNYFPNESWVRYSERNTT